MKPWGRMPAKDIIHETVKAALVKDGWRITHDPLTIPVDDTNVFIDLGAERPLAAEKDGRKIAVEVKSFTGISVMSDLERAFGQYEIYGMLLGRFEPERQLYLAVSASTFANVFERAVGKILISESSLKMIVVDLDRKEIARWIE